MIILQIIAGILLLPLLLLMLLAFNIYIKHWLWFLGILILGMLISGAIWIIFLESSYAAYSLLIFCAVYLYRMYRLTSGASETKQLTMKIKFKKCY